MVQYDQFFTIPKKLGGLMTDQLPLVFEGSPFLPQFDIPQVVESIKQYLIPSEPAACIALTISPMMTAHSYLLRLDVENLRKFNVSNEDLMTLIHGFRYPLETIQASAVCKEVAGRSERLKLYEHLVTSTYDFTLLLMQEQIATDLNATCNLLKLDPSAGLLFKYLKDYPFSKDEFFLTGMEIAARIFFGLSLELAKALGDDSWLQVDYSRPPYIPPDSAQI